MFYELMRVRKDGKLIPKWELGGDPFVRGQFTVKERFMRDLGRHSRVACFGCSVDVPDLYDVTLLHTDSEGCIVLTGFEHRVDIPGRPVDFAQTWVLRISGDQSPLRSLEAIMERAKDTARA